MKLHITFTAAQAAPYECSADLENAINKVLFNLKRNCRKYFRTDEFDMVKSYAGDWCDWNEIHKALVTRCDVRQARKLYSNMDTASRDYLSHYGGITSKSGELCKEAEKVFGVQFA